MNKNPIPQGKYKPAVRHGDLIFTAGMTPRKDGVLLMSGRVSSDQPVEFYRDAIRQAAANALTAARNCLAEGERIAQILSLTVYVNAAPDYTTHAKIGDVASEYLFEQLGDAGIGPRAAIGVATLPGGAPVEIQLVAAAQPL
ncbi:MAG: RidA family protein [Lawsonibacter sp.]|nr:RidA family protein [Lawsonibacter sp.]